MTAVLSADEIRTFYAMMQAEHECNTIYASLTILQAYLKIFHASVDLSSLKESVQAIEQLFSEKLNDFYRRVYNEEKGT